MSVPFALVICTRVKGREREREGDRERVREIERIRERVRDNHAVVKVQYLHHIKSTVKCNTRKKRHRSTILAIQSNVAHSLV